MERASRLPVLTLALAATVVVAAATEAGAVVTLTQGEALARAFPGAEVERLSFVLTEPQARAVAQRARVKLRSKLVAAYAARRQGVPAGVAFFETRNVRTMPVVLMIVVAPDTTVRRVELLAFHEPPDYRPTDRWLRTFDRRRLDDRLWPRLDIKSLSGATLSVQAITESVRQALALYETVVAPALAGDASPAAASGAGRRPAAASGSR